MAISRLTSRLFYVPPCCYTACPGRAAVRSRVFRSASNVGPLGGVSKGDLCLPPHLARSFVLLDHLLTFHANALLFQVCPFLCPTPTKNAAAFLLRHLPPGADVQMRRKPGTSTHLHNFSVNKFELRIIFYAKRLESSRIRLPGSQKSTAGAFKYMIVGNVTYGIGYSNSILLFKFTVEFVIVIYDDPAPKANR